VPPDSKMIVAITWLVPAMMILDDVATVKEQFADRGKV
jgi:hypothetical protein